MFVLNEQKYKELYDDQVEKVRKMIKGTAIKTEPETIVNEILLDTYYFNHEHQMKYQDKMLHAIRANDPEALDLYYFDDIRDFYINEFSKFDTLLEARHVMMSLIVYGYKNHLPINYGSASFMMEKMILEYILRPLIENNELSYLDIFKKNNGYSLKKAKESKLRVDVVKRLENIKIGEDEGDMGIFALKAVEILADLYEYFNLDPRLELILASLYPNNEDKSQLEIDYFKELMQIAFLDDEITDYDETLFDSLINKESDTEYDVNFGLPKEESDIDLYTSDLDWVNKHYFSK